MPHDHPRRRPGRQHAAPARRSGQRAGTVVRVQALGVRRRCRGWLLRAVQPTPQPLPVMAWARAYGLIRDPGSEPYTVCLIGPRPRVRPWVRDDHQPGRPGDHRHPHYRRRRACRAAADRWVPPPVQGHRDRCRACRPSCSPPPRHCPSGTRSPSDSGPPGDGRLKGDPAMTTVTIWHNTARDGEGRLAGMLDGYQPGDPVVRVFAYQADLAGRTPEEIAEEAFASATATSATRTARTWPAATTSASCGRCPCLEGERVAAGRVAGCQLLCCPR